MARGILFMMAASALLLPEATAQVAKLTHGDAELTREAGIALQQVVDPGFARVYHNLGLPASAETEMLRAQASKAAAPGVAAKAAGNYGGSMAIKYGTDAVRKPMGDYVTGDEH